MSIRKRYTYLSYADQLRVCNAIRQCIENEAPFLPIPDQEIGRQITDETGIRLDKSHVEYYRKKLGFPSYIERKQTSEPVQVGSVRRPASKRKKIGGGVC